MVKGGRGDLSPPGKFFFEKSGFRFAVFVVFESPVFNFLIRIRKKMARYEHLPIYRDAFRFLIFCENTVKNFSRYNKYTHGSDLRDAARNAVKLIIRAKTGKRPESRRDKSCLSVGRAPMSIQLGPLRPCGICIQGVLRFHGMGAR